MNPAAAPLWRTEHGIPIRNVWHMLMYAWQEPGAGGHLAPDELEAAPSLEALFALLLARSIQQRLRIGLGQAYVNRSKTVRGIRGRIDFTESLKRQAFESGEAYCDFQEYSVNEPRNQVIRSTLSRLVQAGELGPDRARAEELRLRLRRLVRNLDGVDLIEPTPEFVRRLQLSQEDHDYRFMLALCELVLLHRMPADRQGHQPVPALEREALVLHRIYERFVAGFYRFHLTGWEVIPQKRLDWHAGQANEHLPAMVPDLVLRDRSTGRVIVLDTKFTAESLAKNRWGKPVYDSAHLYQLYAYVRTQEQTSAAHRQAAGILLYPAIHGNGSERSHIQGHEIRIEWLDLSVAWPQVEERLLAIVKTT